jgi:hypothetical protein
MNRHVFSPLNGQPVKVSADLNVKPLLFLSQPIINGNKRQIMDDEWIFVDLPKYGTYPINLNRAYFCQKVYLSNTPITSLGNFFNLSKNKQQFIDSITSSVVFDYNGIVFHIFITKIGRIYDFVIKPYWLANKSPNLLFKNLPIKYKEILIPDPKITWGHRYAGDFIVDTNKVFGYDEN